ncbi:hypothetical protein [Streptomyces sp. NPDC006309]|uniref:hypothetical protein n=1 Tax=Streptomyces sp. NPDC006309 TaxID=3156749 RepID=UPI0033A33E66
MTAPDKPNATDDHRSPEDRRLQRKVEKHLLSEQSVVPVGELVEEVVAAVRSQKRFVDDPIRPGRSSLGGPADSLGGLLRHGGHRQRSAHRRGGCPPPDDLWVFVGGGL